jgi:PncC family amidohydrolase
VLMGGVILVTVVTVLDYIIKGVRATEGVIVTRRPRPGSGGTVKQTLTVGVRRVAHRRDWWPRHSVCSWSFGRVSGIGIVAYDSMLKTTSSVSMPPRSLSSGAVSAEVAIAMAEGAQQRLGVDLAVATTGVAGPDPDPVSGASPGVVFIAVAGGGLGTLVRELALDGDRAEIRQRATRAALQALRDGLATRE